MSTNFRYSHVWAMRLKKIASQFSTSALLTFGGRLSTSALEFPGRLSSAQRAMAQVPKRAAANCNDGSLMTVAAF